MVGLPGQHPQRLGVPIGHAPPRVLVVPNACLLADLAGALVRGDVPGDEVQAVRVRAEELRVLAAGGAGCTVDGTGEEGAVLRVLALGELAREVEAGAVGHRLVRVLGGETVGQADEERAQASLVDGGRLLVHPIPRAAARRRRAYSPRVISVGVSGRAR